MIEVAGDGAPGVFSTLYYSGPAWSWGLDFEEQAGHHGQVAWWRERESSGELTVVGAPMGTPPADLVPVFLVIWHANNLAAAERLAAAAPMVGTGVLLASTVQGAPQE